MLRIQYSAISCPLIVDFNSKDYILNSDQCIVYSIAPNLQYLLSRLTSPINDASVTKDAISCNLIIDRPPRLTQVSNYIKLTVSCIPVYYFNSGQSQKKVVILHPSFTILTGIQSNDKQCCHQFRI